MLSYQHAYHAGNPADVLKHAIWAEVLTSLVQKPKPLNVYETHSGRGLYSVEAAETQKTPEYLQGLAKFQPFTKRRTPYFSAVNAHNPGGRLTTIPGSPAVAAHILRKDMDHLHLAEAHPGEFEFLQIPFHRQNHIHLHHLDGHTHIPSLVRPGTRVAVLIDPSYEVKTEYLQVVETVAKIIKQVPQATVMVWYPILPAKAHQQLIDGLKTLAAPDTWLGQITWPSPGPGLTGTGQIIVGLPYKLEVALEATIKSLSATMFPKFTPTTTFLTARS
jgi:23S rRNA (adenine2030-N6)-methyltransferase